MYSLISLSGSAIVFYFAFVAKDRMLEISERAGLK